MAVNAMGLSGADWLIDAAIGCQIFIIGLVGEGAPRTGPKAPVREAGRPRMAGVKVRD